MLKKLPTEIKTLQQIIIEAPKPSEINILPEETQFNQMLYHRRVCSFSFIFEKFEKSHNIFDMI